MLCLQVEEIILYEPEEETLSAVAHDIPDASGKINSLCFLAFLNSPMSLIRTTFCRTTLGRAAGKNEVSNYSHWYIISTSYSDLFVSHDIKAIYTRILLLKILYKKLKIGKVQLEIKRLEKEVQMQTLHRFMCRNVFN